MIGRGMGGTEEGGREGGREEGRKEGRKEGWVGGWERRGGEWVCGGGRGVHLMKTDDNRRGGFRKLSGKGEERECPSYSSLLQDPGSWS